MKDKIIKYKFKKFNTIDKKELLAVKKVLKSGVLSSFLGSKSKNFYGGKKVLEFEKKFRNYFGVKYAISVNSWTSGLVTIIGAIGTEPGDEVILPTWTMSACASAILNWNAIPVFVDIDKNTFCLDPALVKKKITNKTKAILTVDLFGHPANIAEIKKIIKNRNITLISDTAQAIGSIRAGKFTGTDTDIGGYSFNYHKHIHTGEGGMIVTNNKNFANRCLLIRNHGEAVINSLNKNKIKNILGYNFRLGEIESSIGIEQLKKLKKIVKNKQKIAQVLTDGLKNLTGLKVPLLSKGYTHSYYIYPMSIDKDKIKVSKFYILKKLMQLGVQGLRGKYICLHKLPMFQKKICYGKKNFPWTLNPNKITYSKDMYPVAEYLQNTAFIGLDLCSYDFKLKDAKLIVMSFKKVWSSLESLGKIKIS